MVNYSSRDERCADTVGNIEEGLMNLPRAPARLLCWVCQAPAIWGVYKAGPVMLYCDDHLQDNSSGASETLQENKICTDLQPAKLRAS
jgi:hypothetical protein